MGRHRSLIWGHAGFSLVELIVLLVVVGALRPFIFRFDVGDVSQGGAVAALQSFD